MSIPELETSILLLEEQIRPLAEKLAIQRRSIEEAKSRQFISVNGITIASVQKSNGPGVPWFGYVGQFSDWLRRQPAPLRWAEWNGRIYHTADLIAGRMPETPALYVHLTA